MAAACMLQDPASDPQVRRDLKTMTRFVEVFCKGNHGDAARQPTVMKMCDLAEISGRSPELCLDCTKLLTHAFVKRMHCPMDPKPACKHCPVHCYHPTYRQQMREVMRYSGRKIMLSGRIDYLLHILF